MGDQQLGTLCFLFTDIERSSRGWEQAEREMLAALERHDAAVEDAVAAHNGRVFKHTGDGVAAVFSSATEAVLAAVDAQRGLAAGPLLVRIGVHTGEAFERSGDYFGPALNRAARLMAAAHGGQVVTSSATEMLARGRLPEGVRLADLGEYVLRDVGTERIFQVMAPGLERTFPALHAEGNRSRIPGNRSPLVGRERDLDVVAELLDRSRVVTLTGIGGAGKTRLALELAARVAERYPDGTYLVDLASVSDPSVLPSTLAAALELRLGGGLAAAHIDVMSELTAHLSSLTALVVFDNCEHLLDPVGELIDRVLDRCPSLTVLATSREALQVEGETAWRVPSLALPDDGAPAAAASVQLFVQRASNANPDFALAPDNERAVADICRRLDGIPLAIEFAAAQVAHLTPAQIASRLDDRFRLLVGGRRRSQRQQTLQAVLDWSHDLLSADERAVLRRLAVFAGGFSLEAAEAVCDGATARPVTPLLGSLVAKSLVVADHGREEVRYRLLETVRLYAEEKLHQAGESVSARDAHRDWYVSVLQRIPWDRAFLSFTTAVALERDVDNLRVALEWSAETDRPDLVADMVARLNSMWWINARVDEATRWLDVAAGAADLPDTTRAACASVRAFVSMIRGDYLDAMTTWEAAASMDPGGAPALVAGLMRGVIGLLADPDVEGHLQEVERRALAAGLRSVVNGAREQLAHLRIAHGRMEEAIELFADVVAHEDTEETFFFDLAARLGLAVTFHLLGDHDECIAEARRLLGLRDSEATRLGDEELASELELFGVTMAHLALALGHAGRREFDEARWAAGEVVAISRRRRLPIIRRDALLALAATAVFEDDLPRAARLLSVARGESRFAIFRTPASYAVYHHYRDLVRRRLTPEEVSRARQEARGLDVEEVIDAELALENDELVPGRERPDPPDLGGL